MSGFLLLFGMGAVTWYALPAAPTWQTKFWSGFLAVFLCPFSWPWLIARGHKARKNAKAKATQEQRTQAAQRLSESVRWWLNELNTAMRDGDHDRTDLAAETLRAMGYFDFCDCQRCRSAGNPQHRPASPMA
jgi:hypothetical protein